MEDKKKYQRFSKGKRCRFCRDKNADIDYKNVPMIQRLCSSQGKVSSRKRSGNCARHQRMVQLAIKRARFMALLPYIT